MGNHYTFDRHNPNNVIRRGAGFNVYRDKYNPEINVCLEVWAMEGVNLHVKNGKIMIIMPKELAANMNIINRNSHRPDECNNGDSNDDLIDGQDDEMGEGMDDGEQPATNAFNHTPVTTTSTRTWPPRLSYNNGRQG